MQNWTRAYITAIKLALEVYINNIIESKRLIAFMKSSKKRSGAPSEKASVGPQSVNLPRKKSKKRVAGRAKMPAEIAFNAFDIPDPVMSGQEKGKATVGKTVVLQKHQKAIAVEPPASVSVLSAPTDQ